MNKKVTIEDLAMMVAKGFDGVDKRFDKLEKKVDDNHKKLTNDILNLRDEVSSRFSVVDTKLGIDSRFPIKSNRKR